MDRLDKNLLVTTKTTTHNRYDLLTLDSSSAKRGRKSKNRQDRKRKIQMHPIEELHMTKSTETIV